MDTLTQRKYLYGHNSPETARTVGDYPWGFRLRTTIRYWVETKGKYGQRFASQTINPKTGKWCEVKYSKYSPIVIMFLDENEHVKYTTLNHNDGDYIKKFKETHLENLNDYQKGALKEMMAYEKVMKNVTFSFSAVISEPISLFSQNPVDIEKRKKMLADCEKREEREKQMLGEIGFCISQEMSKIKL